MGGGDPRDLTRGALAADGDAFVSPDGTRTAYAALRAAKGKAARALASKGVRDGTLVAVCEPSPLGALVAVLAAWSIGAPVLPIDRRSPDAAMDRALVRARPRVVVRSATPEGRLDLDVLPDGRDPRELSGAALILFTSGSTAEPKGVVLGARGIAANIEAILDYLPVRDAGVVALASPIAYSYGLIGQALTTLVAGGTLVEIATLGFVPEQLAAIDALGVRGLSSVPTLLRALARAVLDGGGTRPALRFVASAGAALDATGIELLARAFPNAELLNQYGLTEASPRVAAVSSRTECAFRDGSVGRALRGMQVSVRREDGTAAVPNEVGRLYVRGPSVMLGYLDDPSATRAAVDTEGWLDTGDFARLDADGYLFVVGRRDGVVKCGGERVSVEEIASTLRSAEGVRDAYVLAAPHAELGASLWAFVECDSSAFDRLRAYVRAELPPAKRPAHLVRMDFLPRGANGKIAVTDLHARIGERPRKEGRDVT